MWHGVTLTRASFVCDGECGMVLLSHVCPLSTLDLSVNPLPPDLAQRLRNHDINVGAAPSAYQAPPLYEESQVLTDCGMVLLSHVRPLSVMVKVAWCCSHTCVLCL